MLANIQDLKVGQKFKFGIHEFEVTEKETYSTSAKCIQDEDNYFEGLEVVFYSEIVEVPEGTELLKQSGKIHIHF